jgi:hypothetical protein
MEFCSCELWINISSSRLIIFYYLFWNLEHNSLIFRKIFQSHEFKEIIISILLEDPEVKHPFRIDHISRLYKKSFAVHFTVLASSPGGWGPCADRSTNFSPVHACMYRIPHNKIVNLSLPDYLIRSFVWRLRIKSSINIKQAARYT